MLTTGSAIEYWQVLFALAVIVSLFFSALKYQDFTERQATLQNAPPPISSGVYWAVFWGFMWILASFWFAYLCANGIEKVPGGPNAQVLFALFLLSGVIGGAAAWLLGVFFFPVDSSEQQTFNRIATMLGSLVTGYLLKIITDSLQVLGNTDGGKKIPLFLTPGYRECIAFFLVSLLVSAGVQIAVRTLSAVRISWDGPVPPFDPKDGYVIEPGKSYQLAGAATGAENVAVRWALSAIDNARLQKALAAKLLDLSDSGTLTTKPEAAWTPIMPADLDFQIVASAAGRPEIVKMLAAHVGKTPPAVVVAAKNPPPPALNP